MDDLSPRLFRRNALPSMKQRRVVKVAPRPRPPSEVACRAPGVPGGSGVAMDVFGTFALILAFVCAVYAFGGGIAAIITRHPLLIKSTRQAGMATCCLIFLATFSLESLFFSDNFS